MQQSRLVSGLAAAFGVMAVVLSIVGVVANLVVLVPAVLFAVVAVIFWYHGSGRLAARFYHSVERRARADSASGSTAAGGGFGAGPHEEWTGPRSEQRQRGRKRQRRTQRADHRVGGPRQRADGGPGATGMSSQEAFRILGVEGGADQDTIRRAYRQRVKEVHPDADGGDTESFQRVRDAYELLTS